MLRGRTFDTKSSAWTSTASHFHSASYRIQDALQNRQRVPLTLHYCLVLNPTWLLDTIQTCQSHSINVKYNNQATYLQRHKGAGKTPAARCSAAQYVAKKTWFLGLFWTWSIILHTFTCFQDTASVGFWSGPANSGGRWQRGILPHRHVCTSLGDDRTFFLEWWRSQGRMHIPRRWSKILSWVVKITRPPCFFWGECSTEYPLARWMA